MKKSYTTLKMIGLLFLLIGILSFNQKNYAQIINPGFETGSISPWVGTSNASTSTGMTVLAWTVNPADIYMASVLPTSGLMIATAETNLGLSSGSLVTFNSGLFNTATNFGTITQNVTLTAGQTFHVYWNYISQDYTPFNDGIIATLVGPSSFKEIHLLAVTADAYGDPEALLTGSYGSTDWHSISFTAAAAGTYTLGFACFNTGDQSVDPILLLDNAPGGTSAPGEPIVVTSNVSSITTTTATSGGDVTSDGGSTVTARGICWNTSSLPTTVNTHTTDGTGTGIFTSNMIGLTSGTTYYVRAYATNSVGTVYGSEEIFATTGTTPADPTSISVSVNPICNGTSTQLTANGAVGTVYWYTGSCGGTEVATGNPINVSPTSNTTYYARNNNAGNFSTGCASTTINVDAVSVGGTVAGGTTICSGTTSGLLTLTGNTGTVVKWQSSVSPFSSWTDIAYTAVTYTSLPLAETTKFRAIVQNGSCTTANSISTTVTIGDITNPTITCQSNVSTTVTAGACSKSIVTTNPTTADNCTVSKLTWAMTGATIANSAATGINNVGTYTFNLGLTTVTYTVYDAANNSATGSFTVTVTDNINPTITCQSNVSTTVTAGACSKSVVTSNPTTADNCTVSKLTWAMTGATIANSAATGINNVGTYTFNLGLTTVTYTVYDAANNSATGSFTVTVTDNINPTITCQSNVSTTVTAGACSKSVATTNPTTADNCTVSKLTWAMTGATIANSAATGINNVGTYTFNLGLTTVTYTVYDAANNSATGSFTVTVTDNINPTITCQSNVSTTITAGACSKSVVTTNPTIADNCTVSKLTWAMTGATIANSAATGINNVGTYTFNLGLTTVTYTVYDAANNSVTGSYTVTVTDNINPTITCQSNVSTTVTAGACSKSVVTTNPTIADNCTVSILTWAMTGATVANSAATGINNVGTYTFNLGLTTVTYTVYDAANNSVTGSYTVTVTDNINPTITCQSNVSTTVTAGACSKSVVTTNPTIADNCTVSKLTWAMTGATVANSAATGINNVGTYTFNLGLTTVTYTVYDAANNSTTASFTITVTDNINPTAIAKDITIYLNASGSVSILASDIDNGSYDNCSIASIAASKTDFTCADLGTNNVILMVTDASTNSSTAISIVTVVDNMNPIADVTNLPNVTAECSATLTVPTATDNCAGVISATTSDPLTYTTQGTYTVNWSYNDGNGNTSSQTQNVIVDDATAPVFEVTNLPDIIGGCSATVVSTPTATDNCIGSIIATTLDPLTYTAQGTYIINWNYDDGNGNTSSQTQNVIVDDASAPVFDVTNLPDIIGECSATVVSTPTATDNCIGLIIATTSDPLTYTAQGTYIINWNYDDGNGNTSSQTQTVIVDDVSAPTYTALPNIYSCNGTVSGIVPIDVLDNCSALITIAYELSGATIATGFDDASSEIFNPGITTVTYTLTDENENSSQFSFTVTYEIINVSVTIKETTLMANGTGTYQWFDCNTNVPIADETSQTFTPSESGNYSVIISNNGCSDTSECYIIIVTNIPETRNNSQFEISVYPNPTNGKIYVSSNTENLDLNISIIDVNGKEVYSCSGLNSKSNLIDVENLCPSIYFMKISNKQEQKTIKFVKQ